MIVSPSDRISNVETYYFATKLAQIAEMNQQGIQVLNLGIGSPDLEPPVKVIETLTTQARSERMNSYQSYRGIPELREAFLKILKM